MRSKALGLTLSPHQAEVARERIRAAGLGSKCRIEVEDFLQFRPIESFRRRNLPQRASPARPSRFPYRAAAAPV